MQSLNHKQSSQETEERTRRQESLEILLEEIREDAEQNPKDYLNETVVPGGGE